MENNCRWKLATLSVNSSVHDAINSLEETGLKIVIIVSSEFKPIGTFSDGDLRRAILSDMKLCDPIIEYMNKSPLLVPENLTDSSIQQIMSVNAIAQLPIIDQNGRLVGIRTLDEVSMKPSNAPTMVIMAGGKGTRLNEYTRDIPKPLVKVGGKPLIRHIIDKAKKQGIKKFVISINHMGELIKTAIGDGSAEGIKIDYVSEVKPLGTAGSLSLIDFELGENVVVTNCDILCDFEYIDIFKYHERNQATATVAVRKHQIKNEFGVVDLNGIDIEGFSEKPVYVSNINAGVYVLSKKIFSLLEYSEVCDMPTLLSRAIEKSLKVIAFPLHEDWLDVGRVSDLREAEKRHREKNSDKGY